MLRDFASVLLCAVAALLIVAFVAAAGFFDGDCRVRAAEAGSPLAWIRGVGC